MRPHRLAPFVIVGAIGFGVQLAAFALLTRGARWPVAVATAASVLVAVVHNFAWHERWTWRDRARGGRERLAALGTFILTTGVMSIAGNVVLMTFYTVALGVNAFIAAALSVVSITVFNFAACDRVVFRNRP